MWGRRAVRCVAVSLLGLGVVAGCGGTTKTVYVYDADGRMTEHVSHSSDPAPGGRLEVTFEEPDDAGAAAAAQSDRPLAGEWEGEGRWVRGRTIRPLHLTLVTVGKGRQRRSSRHWSAKQLDGLAPAGDPKAAGPVAFATRFAPGTLVFDGEREGAEASGTVRFEPDPAYAKELSDALGAPVPATRLADLLFHDLPPAYVRGFAAAGHKLTLDDALRLKAHGVTPEQAAPFRKAGYELSLDDLIKARNFGVSPDAAAAWRDAGYAFGLDELIKARNFGVDPASAKRVRQAGYGLDLDALIRMKNFGITADYAAAMRDAGYDFSVDDLIRLKNFGVTPEYAAALHNEDLEDLTVDDLVALRQRGVDEQLLRRLRGTPTAATGAKE